MQLVIKVDLDKAKQPLAEIFKLIGECDGTHAVEHEATEGAVMLHHDAIGTWSIDEAAAGPHPMESAFRAAASARYSRPGEIEVDRFASVSLTQDGAYVQGWLFVPREEAAAGGEQSAAPRKPPQSVMTFGGETQRRLGSHGRG